MFLKSFTSETDVPADSQEEEEKQPWPCCGELQAPGWSVDPSVWSPGKPAPSGRSSVLEKIQWGLQS